MYANYGDIDFFENGILVNKDRSDTVFDMLCCKPYADEEDLFQFGIIEVDINDSWIDTEAVEGFCGCKKEEDPVGFAIGCTEYYSWDNFGAVNFSFDWQRMTKKEIKEYLRKKEVSSINLNITW